MKILRAIAALGVVALGACRPAQSPDVQLDVALRSKVLFLYRASTSGPVIAGGVDHAISGSCTASVVAAGVLTAAHCAGHATKFVVRAPNGRDIATTLVRIDAYRDLALLESEEPLPASLRMRLGVATPPVGASVAALGSSMFGRPVFAKGTIAADRSNFNGPRFLVNMPAWPGLSGAPVVIQRGDDVEMIGLATSWLNLDGDEAHVRMFEVAPIDVIAEFLANKPSDAALAANRFARARRDAVMLHLDVKQADKDHTLSVAPYALRAGMPIGDAIDLEVTRDGHAVARGQVAESGELDLPVTASEASGITIVARGSKVGRASFVLANPSGLAVLAVPENSVRFEVKVGARKKGDAWVDFTWSAYAAQGMTGHGLLLRPIVLRGSDVQGASKTASYYADLDPEVPLDSYDLGGRIWAPTGGVYDVVLLSSSTPIAYERVEIPPPIP